MFKVSSKNVRAQTLLKLKKNLKIIREGFIKKKVDFFHSEQGPPLQKVENNTYFLFDIQKSWISADIEEVLADEQEMRVPSFGFLEKYFPLQLFWQKIVGIVWPPLPRWVWQMSNFFFWRLPYE